MPPSLPPRATLPVSSSYPMAVQSSSRELRTRLMKTRGFKSSSSITSAQLSSPSARVSAFVRPGQKEVQTRSSPKQFLQVRTPLVWEGQSSCLFKSIWTSPVESHSLGRGESHNAVRWRPTRSFVEVELEVDVGLLDADRGIEARNVSENKCEIGCVVAESEAEYSPPPVVQFASRR